MRVPMIVKTKIRFPAAKCVQSLTLAVAFAVAIPEDLSALPVISGDKQPAFIRSELLPSDLLLVHCCHGHPLPPYDRYCCHSGGAYYGGAYYGAAGVRGSSRRVARRTTRRVSRRR